MTMSADAHYCTVRALADRGEDYGYSVYYKGTTISRAERQRLIEMDDAAAFWLEAFDAALAAHKKATGEDWVY